MEKVIYYIHDNVDILNKINPSSLRQQPSNQMFFLVPSGTKIVAILGIQYSQRFKEEQLYIIYKYVNSSNVGLLIT